MSSGSRAGWLRGIFRAMKLWNSSSTSGPDAREKPIRPKSSVSSSVTFMRICRLPIRGRRPGSVTSAAVSPLLSAARAVLRDSKAAVTRSLSALIFWPTTGF